MIITLFLGNYISCRSVGSWKLQALCLHTELQLMTTYGGKQCTFCYMLTALNLYSIRCISFVPSSNALIDNTLDKEIKEREVYTYADYIFQRQTIIIFWSRRTIFPENIGPMYDQNFQRTKIIFATGHRNFSC